MLGPEALLNGPIPGESLTREPGNAMWEQPPQFAKVDEALNFYITNLEEDEIFEDVLSILDNDMPLDLFVDTMLLNGEMYGKHTSDVSLIIGPMLHEYIKTLAEAAGVKVREFQGKDKAKAKKERELIDVQSSLNFKKPMPPKVEMPLKVEKKEAPVESPKRGLLSRRA
jgi:hypothetical protein